MADAPEPEASALDEVAERAARAARAVLEQHGLEHEPGESAVSALAWARRESIPHEAAFRAFAQVVVDELGVADLVASKIELLSDYKLDYPQDYEPDDVDRMTAEIARLQRLAEALGRARA